MINSCLPQAVVCGVQGNKPLNDAKRHDIRVDSFCRYQFTVWEHK